jgi:hypothetical protein
MILERTAFNKLLVRFRAIDSSFVEEAFSIIKYKWKRLHDSEEAFTSIQTCFPYRHSTRLDFRKSLPAAYT